MDGEARREKRGVIIVLSRKAVFLPTGKSATD